MTEKLLPCPFCGSEASAETIPVLGGGYMYAFVECQSETCNGSSGGHDSETEAIAAWNRRAQPDNKPITCDDVPVVRGKWEYEHGAWCCSKCGENNPYGVDYETNRFAAYCPNCGAKMERDFGVSLFLTLEEAEAALKGTKHEQD